MEKIWMRDCHDESYQHITDKKKKKASLENNKRDGVFPHSISHHNIYF